MMTVSAVPPDVVAQAAAAAKAWLRAGDGDDATVATLCASAIALAEAFCGQVFVARDVTETLAPSGGWQPLASAPVTAITAVSAVDATGAVAALSTDAYAIDIDARGTGWVRTTRPIDAARLSVAYAAGEGTSWEALPAPVAQGGIAMLVAHLFDDRDGTDAPPAAIAALWRPWRRIGLAQERRA